MLYDLVTHARAAADAMNLMARALGQIADAALIAAKAARLAAQAYKEQVTYNTDGLADWTKSNKDD